MRLGGTIRNAKPSRALKAASHRERGIGCHLINPPLAVASAPPARLSFLGTGGRPKSRGVPRLLNHRLTQSAARILCGPDRPRFRAQMGGRGEGAVEPTCLACPAGSTTPHSVGVPLALSGPLRLSDAGGCDGTLAEGLTLARDSSHFYSQCSRAVVTRARTHQGFAAGHWPSRSSSHPEGNPVPRLVQSI